MDGPIFRTDPDRRHHRRDRDRRRGGGQGPRPGGHRGHGHRQHHGIERHRRRHHRTCGGRLVATGDMGIGNTTASSAIVAAITGRPVADVTGLGTGLDARGWRHKVATIERALQVNRPDPADPLDVLAKVGGYEIAGLVGVFLGAAAHRLPVLVDGFISGTAALLVTELCPPVRDYLIAAHNSVEVGHRIVLERMELVPLLNLDLRLGEGTGAAMAMHLVDDAAAILDEMATFAEAGVSDREPPTVAGEEMARTP